MESEKRSHACPVEDELVLKIAALQPVDGGCRGTDDIIHCESLSFPAKACHQYLTACLATVWVLLYPSMVGLPQSFS